MIASVSGTIADREGDTVVVHTDGGVGYAVTVPLGVFERLPPAGHRVTLFTELVVREEEWSLFGFDRPVERTLFRRLLAASGIGPRLALSLLSHLGADRTVESIRRRDVAALASVSGIGRKKAERLLLDLEGKLDDLPAAVPAAGAAAGGADAAVQALVGLGYLPAQADEAVRAAVADGGPADAQALLRRALQQLAPARAGR